MIDFINPILLALSFVQTAELSLPVPNNQFDCKEDVSRRSTFHGGYLNADWVNGITGQRWTPRRPETPKVPCFNSTFPTDLTVEEGQNVSLPCVVHNVDFSSTVVSLLLSDMLVFFF